MTFRIGMKVEYFKLRSEYEPLFRDPAWPKQIVPGGVYTVRDVDTRAAVFGWPLILRFEEYQQAAQPCPELGMWECGFPGDCFRSVVEKKTDISIFTAMLNPNRRERNPAVIGDGIREREPILNQNL